MLVPDSSGTIQYFLNILYWFEEERNTTGNGFMFFLLLVQKKEPKKSTPAMIYSHCRPDSYRD